MLRYSIATVFIALLIAFACQAQDRRPVNRATGTSVKIKHGDLEREYRIYVPESYDPEKPTPVVLCLHGGGGTSRACSRMGMSEVADRHGFIVAYPNAIDKHWNDGRNAPRFEEQDQKIDDSAFLISVVDHIKSTHNIEPDQVFAMGMSNGGFMTHRLAIEHSDVFAAVGIMIASLGEAMVDNFAPESPVSVLFMNGTADPLIGYEGGTVGVELTPKLNAIRGRAKNDNRGRCIATEKAVGLWIERNGIGSQPSTMKFEDIDTEDGCQVEMSLWEGGDQGTSVALYKVIGGGHTIPGSKQYLPERLIGKTNQDVDGFDLILQFFQKHRRR